MKERSIVLAIIFTILTCGIYGIYWFICLTNDSNRLDPKNQTAEGVLAIIFVILSGGIYIIYWAYKLGQKIDNARGDSGSRSIIYLVLELIGLSVVGYALAQNEINHFVLSQNQSQPIQQ